MQIELVGLHKSYSDRQILRGVNSVFDSGGIHALMGPSGSGKSTILSLLAGYTTPDIGEIRYFNTEGLQTEFPSLSWLVQSSPLLTRRTVYDNIVLGPLCRGTLGLPSASSLVAFLSSLGISHLRDKKVSTLSGGERQRVAIARAILANDNLLLADEPTASLDHSMRSTVIETLESLADASRIVIVATHDRDVAEKCTTVWQLQEGKLLREKG